MGKYKLVSQEFIDESDNQYDMLRIKLPDGSSKEIWFDITDFYVK